MNTSTDQNLIFSAEIMGRVRPPPYSAVVPGAYVQYTAPEPGFILPPGPNAVPEARSTIIITHGQPALGPTSTAMTCPNCQHDITTTVITEATMQTHLCAMMLLLAGCWCCCCLPFCMDSCQSKRHKCPNCGAFLGTYESRPRWN